MAIHCTSCGAPVRQLDSFGSFRCEYCGVRSAPNGETLSAEGLVLSGHDEDRDCPVCDRPLQSGRVRDKTPALGCAQCHGFLVEHERFGWLVQSEREAYRGPELVPQRPDEAALSRRIACPACRATMEAYFYAGPGNSFIDGCQRCRLVWLDAGELQRIVTAPGRRDGPRVATVPTASETSSPLRAEPAGATDWGYATGGWLTNLLGL